MNYKLSEILGSIDFYGSTLGKTAWYQNTAPGKRGRPPKDKEAHKPINKKPKSPK